MATKIITTIGIDQDIANDQTYTELKDKRQLSNHINQLLRSSLNIRKQEVSEDEKKVREELQKVNVRQTILEEKLREIEESKPQITEAEQRAGFFIMDGKKVRRG